MIVPIRKRHQARRLRKEMTDAERKLWARLRGKNMGGHKFRRQQSIGLYIVDFYCSEKRLVIELDGGQHAEERAAHDRRRTEFLEKQGHRVLRFWNNEVMENLDGVVEAIALALRERDHER